MILFGMPSIPYKSLRGENLVEKQPDGTRCWLRFWKAILPVFVQADGRLLQAVESLEQNGRLHP